MPWGRATETQHSSTRTALACTSCHQAFAGRTATWIGSSALPAAAAAWSCCQDHFSEQCFFFFFKHGVFVGGEGTWLRAHSYLGTCPLQTQMSRSLCAEREGWIADGCQPNCMHSCFSVVLGDFLLVARAARTRIRTHSHCRGALLARALARERFALKFAAVWTALKFKDAFVEAQTMNRAAKVSDTERASNTLKLEI